MNFQKEFEALKKKLDDAIIESRRDIEDSLQELDTIRNVMNKYPDKFNKGGGLDSIVQDAIDYAREVADDGEKLIKAYKLLHKG